MSDLSGFPWFKVVAADILLKREFSRLTDDEFGALVRLWCHYWINGPIEREDVPEKLLSHFEEVAGKMEAKGLLEYREYCAEIKQKRSKAGKKSVEVKGLTAATHVQHPINTCSTDSEVEEKRTEKEQNLLPAPQAVRTAFDQFWQSYPRKVGKGEAQKSWDKQRLNSKLADILKALDWQRTSFDWKKDGGQMIPHPGTYLNGLRWLDEPTGPGAKPIIKSVKLPWETRAEAFIAAWRDGPVLSHAAVLEQRDAILNGGFEATNWLAKNLTESERGLLYEIWNVNPKWEIQPCHY